MSLTVDPKHRRYFENIYGDKNRYEQIMLNFLSNALKFTSKEGSVEVQLDIKQVQKVKNGEKRGDSSSDNGNGSNRCGRQSSFSKSSDFKQPTVSFQEMIMVSGNKSVDTTNVDFIDFTITIIDSGQGISAIGLKNLFVEFKSLDEHKDKNARGTGLGLSICKQIITKMGGQIGVASTIGQGTTFEISLGTYSLPSQQDASKNNSLEYEKKEKSSS